MLSVELFGQLAPQAARRQQLELPSGSKVEQAVLALGLDPEEIGMITINNVQSELQDSLPPDCRLCLFPYLSGG